MKVMINNIESTEVELIVELKYNYNIGDIVLIVHDKGNDIVKIIDKINYVGSTNYTVDDGNECYSLHEDEILGKLKPINTNYKLDFVDGQIYATLINCPIDEIKPKKINESIKSCNCKCNRDDAPEASESFQRLSKDEYYINIAKAVSKRSTCLRRQYGAVIINNDEIISTGYNGSPRGEVNCCDIGACKRLNKPHNSGDYSDCHSVHAEQNAIISASRKEMIGATLYLYGEEDGKIIESCVPCPICSRMIKNSGIVRIVSTKGEIKL